MFAVAKKYESGGAGPGTISTGRGDHGGKSYGEFQLASKVGTLQRFLDRSGYSKEFSGLTPGSTEFDSKWKELSKDNEFVKSQRQFMVETHVDPLKNSLQKSGIDLGNRSGAVQSMLASVATQYGQGLGKKLITESIGDRKLDDMSDEDIIESVQKHRKESVGRYFKSSSEGVRQSVANRSDREKKDLLALVGQTPQTEGTQFAANRERDSINNSNRERDSINNSNREIQNSNLNDIASKAAREEREFSSSQHTNSRVAEKSEKIEADKMNNQYASVRGPTVIAPQQQTKGLAGKSGGSHSTMGVTRNPESVLHSLLRETYRYGSF